ncbi:KappaPI-theraphotoxin-Hs1e [Folsomia candida]|uniref:KappaPI-theraphotoxin-Hs1e n=1 Tax=Folsomia candida TaxID=158441 RepID=A0A226EIS3_FOLCA|nr:KappaPI-theraphotoxin-Hs1e [Folsomia candida]
MAHSTRKSCVFEVTFLCVLIVCASCSPFLSAWRSHLPAQCDVSIVSHAGHPIHPPNVHCDINFTEWFFKNRKCSQSTYHGCKSAGGFHTEAECKDACKPDSEVHHWYSTWTDD